MRDFTLKTYTALLKCLKSNAYAFLPFNKYKSTQASKVAILRHDVDRSPHRALDMAIIENRLNIRSSYYFRIVNQSFDKTVIKKIVRLNHEIGYHYEDLTLCKGDIDAAIARFQIHLNRLRALYPVKTICMHGSPLSKWDNRDIWNVCDYRDFGIENEPYFDIDFQKVFYLTDTGRTWNGNDVSVRDKVIAHPDVSNLTIKSTTDIIEAANEKTLPDIIMCTTHPQRWMDNWIPWTGEFIFQNLKNTVKKAFFVDKK